MSTAAAHHHAVLCDPVVPHDSRLRARGARVTHGYCVRLRAAACNAVVRLTVQRMRRWTQKRQAGSCASCRAKKAEGENREQAAMSRRSSTRPPPHPTLSPKTQQQQPQTQIITPFNVYYNTSLIFRRGEVWRLLTNFFFFGSLGLDFVFHMFFLVKYCKSLEEGAHYTPFAGVAVVVLLVDVVMFGGGRACRSTLDCGV